MVIIYSCPTTRLALKGWDKRRSQNQLVPAQRARGMNPDGSRKIGNDRRRAAIHSGLSCKHNYVRTARSGRSLRPRQNVGIPKLKEYFLRGTNDLHHRPAKDAQDVSGREQSVQEDGPRKGKIVPLFVGTKGSARLHRRISTRCDVPTQPALARWSFLTNWATDKNHEAGSELDAMATAGR